MSAVALPSVRLEGPLASVAFDRFDLGAYGLFLKCKALPESQLAYDWRADTYTLTTPARFAPLLDAAIAVLAPARPDVAPHLFDYQRWTLERALEARRFAAWWDTGLGKGPLILEWCRQVLALTQARVLILEPLQVIPQLREEARRFYGDDLPIVHLHTREELAAWCAAPGAAIGITNYEKLIPGVLGEMRHLGGLAADESSILKSGGGVIKWNLIKSARGIEYKLSCTATPAPNDAMEYASQASFLERLRSEGEVLWTFFSKHPKTGEWSVKPHARGAFYRFMASWSIYLRDPARFGWADVLAQLPPPEISEEPLAITDEQETLRWEIVARKGAGLFSDDRLGVVERTKLAQAARGFLYDGGTVARRVASHKPAAVAARVRGEVAAGRCVLVWTVFDEESRIIAELLPELGERLAVLDGSMRPEARLDVLERFRHGAVSALISKAQLVGYGLNLQFCRSMIFSGFDDSFERMYQAIRRCYRLGQTEPVRVYVPYVPELEGMMFSNVKAKERRFIDDVTRCEVEYIRTLREAESA